MYNVYIWRVSTFNKLNITDWHSFSHSSFAEYSTGKNNVKIKSKAIENVHQVRFPKKMSKSKNKDKPYGVS